MLTRSFSISSDVVITRAFAWNPRCAMIMFVNCVERSTFDISRKPDWIVPLPPAPGAPTTAGPELLLTCQRLLPDRDKSSGPS